LKFLPFWISFMVFIMAFWANIALHRNKTEKIKVKVGGIILLILFIFTGSKILLNSNQNKNFPYTALKNAPEAKITATIDNMTPPKNSTINVTVKGPVSGKVTAFVLFKDRPVVLSGAIGLDGISVIPIRVGNAEAGFTVIVEITVEHEGKKYKTEAVFTPR
jgi:hypothetical protein